MKGSQGMTCRINTAATAPWFRDSPAGPDQPLHVRGKTCRKQPVESMPSKTRRNSGWSYAMNGATAAAAPRKFLAVGNEGRRGGAPPPPGSATALPVRSRPSTAAAGAKSHGRLHADLGPPVLLGAGRTGAAVARPDGRLRAAECARGGKRGALSSRALLARRAWPAPRARARPFSKKKRANRHHKKNPLFFYKNSPFF